MDELFQPMSSNIHYHRRRSSAFDCLCVICSSKSVGMNFGVLTCAPCKAFFRRNARRRELLELPCRHRDLSRLMRNSIGYDERAMRYLQIRRCSSCRLRRCFEVGMKEELVRTEEENDRYKQLVGINRQRRVILKQQLTEIKQLSIPQLFMTNNEFSKEIDWSHLSNIVYAYDTFCLKTFTQQRTTLIFNNTSPILNEQQTNRHPTALTTSVVLAISSFIKSLPVYHSLRRVTQNHLCKTNIRPLMFPNVHELNQSCFSEPWQADVYRSTWEYICGPELFKDFTKTKRLAEQLWITDPIVTRLWIITLFFSTPLHYHDDSPTPTPILKKKQPILQIQNAYVTLLWKYLLHRHSLMESIRIYSNLIRVYLKMQTVGFGMYLQLRSQRDLISTNETISKLVSTDVVDNHKIDEIQLY